MCRLVVFAGACTRCGAAQTWDELSQELPCLEAKNSDRFGGCKAGVFAEEHAFDQECERCAEEEEGGDCVGVEEEEEEEEEGLVDREGKGEDGGEGKGEGGRDKKKQKK